MKTFCRFVLVLGLVIGIINVSACSKKRLSVDSEGVPGSGLEKRDLAGEEGYGGKARDARLMDLGGKTGGPGERELLPMEARAFEDEMIFFEFDSYDLTADSKAVLERKAAWLKANPQYRLRIEGHCDERGTNEYNLALGDRRANAAKNYLVYLGIDPSRISTISYGEERPLDPGHNEEAYRKNRRAEFKLVK